MRLLLIRHGQTPANVLGQLDTDRPGPGLTDLGTRQAAAVPRALRDEKVEGVVASTLVRTQLTAGPLSTALGLGVAVRDGIREVEAGDLEMRADDDAHRIYLSTVFAWAAGDLGTRMPGGPDGTAFFERYDEVVEEVAGIGWDSAAVVSHGAAIRTWVAARAGNVDADFASAHVLSNTGMVVVEGDPRHGWRVVAWDVDPLGGAALLDTVADDPTGEAL